MHIKNILVLSFSICLIHALSADPNLLKQGYDPSADMGISLARGIFAPDVLTVSKFGTNFDVDSISDPSGHEDVWSGGGQYTGFFTTAQSLEVVSSSTNDASAGTGARTIRVFGLDANWTIQSEDVTMNGTTAVDMVNDYIRVYRAYVLTAGSVGYNDGSISIRVDGGGAVCAHIQADRGQTLQAIYTIPGGYTGYVTRAYSAGSSSITYTATTELRIREFGAAERSISSRGISSHKDNEFVSVPQNGMIPLMIAEKTDIWVHVSDCSANNTVAFAGFDIIMIKNDRSVK